MPCGHPEFWNHTWEESYVCSEICMSGVQKFLSISRQLQCPGYHLNSECISRPCSSFIRCFEVDWDLAVVYNHFSLNRFSTKQFRASLSKLKQFALERAKLKLRRTSKANLKRFFLFPSFLEISSLETPEASASPNMTFLWLLVLGSGSFSSVTGSLHLCDMRVVNEDMGK